MKTITIPTHTVPGQDGKPLGFIWFANWLINSDREFNVDGQGIRASMRVERALSKSIEATDGEVIPPVEIDDQDWERLKRAAEAPSAGGYPASPARAVLPWVEAIAGAK